MEVNSKKKFTMPPEGFLGILLIVTIVVLYFTAGGTEGLFSIQSIMNILTVFSYVFIASIGMTMIIITGNIDISFGSVLSAIAILMAGVSKINSNIPFFIFLIAGMILGAILCGLNAILMTKFKIPSLVITLATMQIYAGALLWFVDGSIYNLTSNWTWFSFEAILFGFIPLSVIISFVLLIISILFFRYSRFIKRLYAIGNNKQGAVYAGINVEKTMVIAYMISGVLLALSSAILATAGNRVTTSVGNNFEMRVIAAVVVGGTSAMGGSGNIYGTALGAMLLAIVSPALVFLNINTVWMELFLGLMIVIAVVLSGVRNFKAVDKKIVRKELIVQ